MVKVGWPIKIKYGNPKSTYESLVAWIIITTQARRAKYTKTLNDSDPKYFVSKLLTDDLVDQNQSFVVRKGLGFNLN